MTTTICPRSLLWLGSAIACLMMASATMAGILPLSFNPPPGATECVRQEHGSLMTYRFIWPVSPDGKCWMRYQLIGRIERIDNATGKVVETTTAPVKP